MIIQEPKGKTVVVIVSSDKAFMLEPQGPCHWVRTAAQLTFSQQIARRTKQDWSGARLCCTFESDSWTLHAGRSRLALVNACARGQLGLSSDPKYG